ncbi:hypothetical protein GCM10029964_045550 [Kibdelosporangium lantanae]
MWLKLRRVWICMVVLLGLGALVARRRRRSPRHVTRTVRQRPPSPQCVVVLGSAYGTMTRRTDRRPHANRPHHRRRVHR